MPGPTAILVLALLVWMMVSVPFALNTGASFDLVFNNFLKTAIMSFVVAVSVRRVDDVERLALVYFAGAVVYAGVVITRFDLGDGGNWRLGRLYYYDANDFATFVVTAIPLGIYFLHAGPRVVTRAAAAIGLVVLTLGFVWSGSRGGFIALAAVALFIVLRYSAIPVRWRLAATALVAIVVLATASDHYWQQMGTITSERDYNHTSETGRMQIWSRGIGYMMANPLLGVGPNNFPSAEGTLSPLAERQQSGIGVRWNAAHNSFVQIGAELGLPGLGLFIAIIASAFAALRRAGRAEAARREAAAAADARADRVAHRLRRRRVLSLARLLGNALHARRARRRAPQGDRCGSVKLARTLIASFAVWLLGFSLVSDESSIGSPMPWKPGVPAMPCRIRTFSSVRTSERVQL